MRKYKIKKYCLTCKKRFEVLHGSRIFCYKCRPKNKTREVRKQWELKQNL